MFRVLLTPNDTMGVSILSALTIQEDYFSQYSINPYQQIVYQFNDQSKKYKISSPQHAFFDEWHISHLHYNDQSDKQIKHLHQKTSLWINTKMLKAMLKDMNFEGTSRLSKSTRKFIALEFSLYLQQTPIANYTVSLLSDYHQNGVRMPTVAEHTECLRVDNARGCTPDNPKTPKNMYPRQTKSPKEKDKSPSLASIVLALTSITAIGMFACHTRKLKDTYQQCRSKQKPAPAQQHAAKIPQHRSKMGLR